MSTAAQLRHRLVRVSTAVVLVTLLATASADALSVAPSVPIAHDVPLAAAPAGAQVETGAEAGPSSAQRRLTLGLADHACFVVANGDVRCWGIGGALGNGSPIARTTPASVFGLHDAIAVAGGDGHVCALRAGGRVACWGSNGYGQHGTGQANGVRDAETASGITTAVAVAAGGDHTCALLANGTVDCWGRNGAGQLGQPASNNIPLPTVVPGLSGVTAIMAGDEHTCALLSDGTVECWGDDSRDQLGSTVQSGSTNVPTPVPGVVGATALAGGAMSTCALLAGGTIKCWGDNTNGQLGNGAGLPAPAQVNPVQVVNVSGATAISSGYDHVCALLGSGQVRCWGRDTFGQLGNSQTTNSSNPVAVPGVTASAVAAGLDDTCALTGSGTVWCWGAAHYGANDPDASLPPHQVNGNFLPGLVTTGAFHACALTAARTVQCWGGNGNGQLGLPNVAGPVSTPTTVPGLSNVISLSAGSYHTCAVLMDGTARCWGDNAMGELGNGDSGTGHLSNVPVVVSGLTNAESISAGGDHTCALKTDRTVWCWGDNADGAVGNPTYGTIQATPGAVNITSVQSVSAGSGHTCAIANTYVWCWGAGANGQLGNLNGTRSATPVRVIYEQSLEPLQNVLEVVARYAYSCAIAAGGSVLCWGWNAYDSVGDGDTTSAYEVGHGLQSQDWVSLGVTGNHGVHTCALKSDGAVMCWGANDRGQLGIGSTTTKEVASSYVSGLSDAVQVSVGFGFSCALRATGTITCWGDNNADQLGSTASSPQATPSPVGSYVVGARALAIDAGATHTCALIAGGGARCWGSNGSGRLGDGTTTQRSKPVAVSGLTSATAISAGGAHSCAILVGGTAACWGSNTNGQIGDGSTSTRSVPVAVTGLTKAIAISAGGTHTCALIAGGTVQCWGLNSSGQLGDGSTTDRHAPVTVKTNSTTTLTGVVAISAGTNHTCALLSTGLVRCWGAGANGRLGNGSTSNQPYARVVSGVTAATAVAHRFTSISAGGAHTCARMADGTAKCWGSGADGRLGNGGTANQTTPVAVSALTGVAQVSAGGSHTCALLAKGTVKCWGLNTSGQLGNNSTSPSPTPVTASGLAGATSISAGGSHTAALLSTGGLKAWGLNTSGQVGDGTKTNRLAPHSVATF
ncbi:MAG TPA: hypothetical protein VGI98_09030 [Candidatus Limnocylindrales bacterium]